MAAPRQDLAALLGDAAGHMAHHHGYGPTDLNRNDLELHCCVRSDIDLLFSPETAGKRG
jgi:hypothetical protein